MPVLDFPPLFIESLDKIRARLNADANPGLAPTDSAYLDTTPGGFWYDLTQAPALEFERMYDSLNELAAAMFLPSAWGAYLDLHGVTLGVTRKAAVAATGVVTFTGTPGTLIATGTQVATEQVSPDADPVVFATTTSATIPAGGTIDVPVQAITTGASSNAAAGSVSVLLSPSSGVASLINTQPVTGGADIETDELLRARLLIAFAGAHGSGTIDDYTQWALEEPGVGFATVDPLWAGAGTVRVIISDVNNDAVSQAVIDSLQTRLDPPVVTTALTASVTLPAASIILNSVEGLLPAGVVVIGAQNVVTYTGISGTTLTGCTGGTGAVSGGTQVLQQGRGHGLAPIGAVVVVATPAPVPVAVSATLTLANGYSISGAAGTIAVGATITAAVTDYLNSLVPGGDAVLQAVVARIMDVQGVADVANVLLNGAAANVIVAPLEVVSASSVTLA